MQPTSTQILKINQKQYEKLKGGFNMFKTMKKRIKNEKGLTLIELLAVVVILAIVAAIAVPAIGNIINNSRDRAIIAEASNILSAAKIAVTDGACQGADGTDTTCSNSELDPYYDGDLATGDSVTWVDANTGNRTYSVIYTKFANIKNTEKFTITANTVTETQLVALLEE